MALRATLFVALFSVSFIPPASATNIMDSFEGLGIVTAPGVTIHDDPERGRHLKATLSATKGTHLVRVPAGSILAGRTLADLRAVLTKETHSAESKWLEYLALLPSSCPRTLPMLLSPRDAKQCLSGHFRDRHEAHNIAALSLSPKELRVRCIEHTRSVQFGRSNFVVVPLVDFANHNSQHPNAALVFHKQGDVTLKAIRDISPGDPVHIDYGIASPVDSVDQYGFLNMSDIAHVPAQINFPETKLLKMNNCSSGDASHFISTGTGEPSEGLLYCIMLSTVEKNPKALQRFMEKTLGDFEQTAVHVMALKALKDALTTLLKQYEVMDCGSLAPAVALANEASALMRRTLQHASDVCDREVKKLKDRDSS